MAFSGWTDSDFEIFETPGFDERMSLIRSRITPRLQELGTDLLVPLSATPMPWHPHVARHLRRRVNAPDETWVAFGRDARGYKKYAHLLTGIGADGAFARLVVKADGEDLARLKDWAAQKNAIRDAVVAASSAAEDGGFKLRRAEGDGWVPLSASGVLSDWGAASSDFYIERLLGPGECADGLALVRRVANAFDAFLPLYGLAAGLGPGLSARTNAAAAQLM